MSVGHTGQGRKKSAGQTSVHVLQSHYKRTLTTVYRGLCEEIISENQAPLARKMYKVPMCFISFIGQVLPEFTPVEIVGCEVDEAGSPLALDDG